MRLVLADVSHLPFRSASFDVVIEASVFHLVDDWQATLQETLRVLRSGGWLLRCVEEEEPPPAPIQRLNLVWRECLNALGWKVTKKRWGGSPQEIAAWLQEQGLYTEPWSAASWEKTTTLRKMIWLLEKRYLGATWMMPADLFDAAIERLKQWTTTEYGSELDTEHTSLCHFVIYKTSMEKKG
jgi:SAM-dependent methyltransferase